MDGKNQFVIIPADSQKMFEATLTLAQHLAAQSDRLMRIIELQLKKPDAVEAPPAPPPAPLHRDIKPENIKARKQNKPAAKAEEQRKNGSFKVIKGRRRFIPKPVVAKALPGMMTANDCADACGLTKSAVHMAIRYGRLKAERVDGFFQIKPEDYKSWRESAKPGAPSKGRSPLGSEKLTDGTEDFVIPHIDSFEHKHYRASGTLRKAWIALARTRTKGGMTMQDIGYVLNISLRSAENTVRALKSLGWDILRTYDRRYVLQSLEPNGPKVPSLPGNPPEHVDIEIPNNFNQELATS